jgi:hypothetical protein
MLSASKKWTPREDEQLRTLAAAECSLIRVAAKLGRTMAAVKRRAYLLDIKLKTLREVPRAQQRAAAAPPSL